MDDLLDVLQSADQSLFEKKVIKKILPTYKKLFKPSREEIQHVDTLERLGNLEHYGKRVGGYKVKQPLNIGNLLNSFNRSVVKTAVCKFMEETAGSNFEFVIDISSSTALYVLVPRHEFEDWTFDKARFHAHIPCEIKTHGPVVAIIQLTFMRLDDYLDTKWMNEREGEY